MNPVASASPIVTPTPRVSLTLAAELRVGRDATPRPAWRRLPGLLVFVARFTRELVLANIAMAKLVLGQRPERLTPEFFHYDLTGLRPFEIVILTHCISLTPGTTSVEISDDETTVLIHGLEVANAETVCRGIKHTLERPMLGCTR